MRAQAAGPAERIPRRLRPPDPVFRPRRGEVAAALAGAAVLAQLVFAQVTLVLGVALMLTGRITRWRPYWLAIPVTAGLIWMLADGAHHALEGFAAGPRQITGALLRPGRLMHLSTALGAPAHWLPGQLPIGLIAGAAEAGVLLWLGWRRRPAAGSAGWRPGLIAAVRRRAGTTALAAGQTVTVEGCAIGVQHDTGRLTGFSWSEAERGVLITANSAAAVIDAGLPAACAALRRRKAVLVADLTGGSHLTGNSGLTDLIAGLARSLAVPVAELPASTPVMHRSGRAAIGQAIRRREVLVFPSGAHCTAHVTDLAAVLGGLRNVELRGDAFAWIHGCQAEHAEMVSELVELGEQTGVCVLLSTASQAAAARLARCAEVIVIAGPIDHQLEPRLAGSLTAGNDKTAMPRGVLTVLAPGRPPVRCSAVPIRVGGRP
jgi:hypothetical protein